MVYVGSSWVELDYWTSPSWGDYDARLRVLAYSTQDVASNSSTVYFKLQKRVTGGSAFNNDPLDFAITCKGAKNDSHSATQEWTFGSVSDTSWQDVPRGSDMWWGTVRHRDDGSLSLTATASGDRILGGSFNTDITLSFPTIPRASVASGSPNPLTIGSSGATLTVNTNRKSSSFTHYIRVNCGSFRRNIENVGASTNVSIPYEVLAQFDATSKTKTADILCWTYSGSTQIGSQQNSTVTFQIDDSTDHPVINSVTVEDINARTSAITQDDGIMIANISTLRATINVGVVGDYTELSLVNIRCGSKTQQFNVSGTSQTVVFEFDKVNGADMDIVVIDKRGNSRGRKETWTLIPYQALTATATVSRPSATGSVGVGTLTGMAYGGSFGATQNSLDITVDFKKHDDPDYDPQGTETYTLALPQSGYNPYTDSFTFQYQMDYQYQYDIRFTVSDLFSTAVYTAQMMQGLPILSWDENEVDVFGDLHIHDRQNPYSYQNVVAGFDTLFERGISKNLATIIGSARTNAGVTYTPHNDGSMTAVGTASQESWSEWSTVLLDAGTYVISGSAGDVAVELYTNNGSTLIAASRNGEESTFTTNASATYHLYVEVPSGKTVNTTVYPMIRDARIGSPSYVPNMMGISQFNYSGTWSNQSNVTRDYQITGRGIVIAMPTVYSSDTVNDTGTAMAYVDLRTPSAYVRTLSDNANRLTSSATSRIAAGVTAVYFYDGISSANRLRCYVGCSKNGTNTWFMTFVCIGCSITQV